MAATILGRYRGRASRDAAAFYLSQLARGILSGELGILSGQDQTVMATSVPSGTELNEVGFEEWEKRFFHVVENLMITTVLPLVLYVDKRIGDVAHRKAILGLLESYLVRRNVCRLTTKNYNLLFIQIINRLQDSAAGTGSLDVGALAGIIKAFDDDTNRMPTNEDFRAAFRKETLSNQNAREILFLLALRQVSNGLADLPKLSLGNYTVEHMMPVKWEANWLEREMMPEERTIRARKLKTLGNLTLVTKRLNSKMQNAAWRDKKTHLRKYSSLPLTVEYLDLDRWDEESIERRAQDLMAIAENTWPLG